MKPSRSLFTVVVVAALCTTSAFTLSLGAAERKDPEPVHSRGVQPGVELQSNGTAIIDFVAGSQAAVVGRTESLLESRFAPSADQIVNVPHALFVLVDGTVVMKAIMYRWTTPVDLQIAVPYSDQWQVRAIHVGGIMDYAKVNAVPPMFLSGRDFSSGIATAAVFTVDDQPRRIRSDDTECFPIEGGCFLCFDCWWDFCGAPYNRC